VLPGPHNNRCLTCNLPPARRSKSSPALAEQAAARLAPRVRLVADFDSAELAGLMPQPSSAAGAARLRQQQQAQQARWFDEQTGLRMRATLVSLSACLHVACLPACLPACPLHHQERSLVGPGAGSAVFCQAGSAGGNEYSTPRLTLPTLPCSPPPPAGRGLPAVAPGAPPPAGR
jgi:hypothetical protein